MGRGWGGERGTRGGGGGEGVDPSPHKGRGGLIFSCSPASSQGFSVKGFSQASGKEEDESCLPTQEKERNQMPPSPLSQGSEVPFLEVSGGSEPVNQNTRC